MTHLASPRVGGWGKMGHKASKHGTRKCQCTTQDYQGRWTTPLPHACNPTKAKRPFEHPIERPCVDAHGRVVAQPATGVQRAHVPAGRGSVVCPLAHRCP